MQSGYLYHYAFAMILGLIALAGRADRGFGTERDKDLTELIAACELALAQRADLAADRSAAALTLRFGSGRASAARWLALGRRAADVRWLSICRCSRGFDYADRGDAVRRDARLDPGATTSATTLGVDGISIALIVLTTLTTAAGR